jgi:hypothetical protein
MQEFTHFSPRASLATVGLYMQEKNIWNTVENVVQIQQKVNRYKPVEKLMDAFINILAGGQGIVEINTRVKPDRALQQAFGRTGCADQSSVSHTLNVCTPENVDPLRTALEQIYQQHSQGYQHDYQKQYQLLDVDMTGMPAGRKGEGVAKGYFPKQKNQRGRQLGRVSATWYDEIVVDRLYTGKRQLGYALQEVVAASEAVLKLDEPRRQRTILRLDRGGGTDTDINWMLLRGYELLVKMHSWRRAQKLAASVRLWQPDPKDPGREIGLVEEPCEYAKPTCQVAVRTRKADGDFSYTVLVSSLSDEALQQLLNVPDCSQDRLAAIVHAYDLRGGGIETQNRNDKQGLGLTKRHKASFAAQEMLVLLAQLAHNLVVWTRNHLVQTAPSFQQFGILRLVRDVLHIPGQINLDAQGHILRITLNQHHPFALPFVQTFSSLLTQNDLSLIWSQI